MGENGEFSLKMKRKIGEPQIVSGAEMISHNFLFFQILTSQLIVLLKPTNFLNNFHIKWLHEMYRCPDVSFVMFCMHTTPSPMLFRFYDRLPVLAWVTKHRSDFELAEMSRFVERCSDKITLLLVLQVFSS